MVAGGVADAYGRARHWMTATLMAGVDVGVAVRAGGDGNSAWTLVAVVRDTQYRHQHAGPQAADGLG